MLIHEHVSVHLNPPNFSYPLFVLFCFFFLGIFFFILLIPEESLFPNYGWYGTWCKYETEK